MMHFALRYYISAHHTFEPISNKIEQNGRLWQLFKFDDVVEYNGKAFLCIIVSKFEYDSQAPDEVICVTDLFAEALEVE